MTSSVKLYPNIDESAAESQQFRLAHISNIQKQLEDELEKYSRARRKYSTTYNSLSNASTGSTILASAAGVTGTILLATGVGTPVSLILGGVAAAVGGLSFIASAIMKKIVKKLEKHESISTLASSKLSSLKLSISKALEDSKVSDEEFKQIQTDFDDYKSKKASIQTKTRAEYNKPLDIEDLKKQFLKKGIQIGREEKVKIESLVKS